MKNETFQISGNASDSNAKVGLSFPGSNCVWFSRLPRSDRKGVRNKNDFDFDFVFLYHIIIWSYKIRIRNENVNIML
jgi:hypothetical protein